MDEDAPKLVLRVDQAKAARMGVAQADIVEVVRLGLSGENVTPVHGGDNKYEVPVRIQLPAVRQSALGNLLAERGRFVPHDGSPGLGDLIVANLRFRGGDRLLSEAAETEIVVRPKLSFADAELPGFDALVKKAKAGSTVKATVRVSFSE